MDKTVLDQIRFCAFCPNICRFNYPTSQLSQRESMFSSALAYLAHAVVNGFIVYTQDVADALSRVEGATVCKEACPYHYDIPANLKTLTKEYEDRITKKEMP